METKWRFHERSHQRSVCVEGADDCYWLYVVREGPYWTWDVRRTLIGKSITQLSEGARMHHTLKEAQRAADTCLENWLKELKAQP